MNIETIKDLFPSATQPIYHPDYSPEDKLQFIQEKIHKIEEDGYEFKGVHTEQIKTMRISHGTRERRELFDPDVFERVAGENLTIATFEKGEGNKRYCIVGSDGFIINESLSTLRSRESHWEANYKPLPEIVNAERMRECLTQEGIQISAYHVFSAIPVNEHMNFEKTASEIKQDLLHFFSRMDEMQGKEELPIEKSDKISCLELNKDSFMHYGIPKKAVQAVSGHFRTGRNKNEQEFIAISVREMMREVGKKLLRDGAFIDSATAQTAGIHREAVASIQEQFKTMNHEEKIKRMQNYLTTPRKITTEQGDCVIIRKTAHPAIVAGVVDAIDETNKNGSPINAARINSNLIRIGAYVVQTGNVMEMDQENIKKATTNIIKNYVSHDYSDNDPYGPYSSYDNLTDIIYNERTLNAFPNGTTVQVDLPKSDQDMKEAFRFLEDAAGISKSERLTDEKMDQCIRRWHQENIGELTEECICKVVETVNHPSCKGKYDSILSILKEEPNPEMKNAFASDIMTEQENSPSSLPEGNRFNMYFKDIMKSDENNTGMHVTDDIEICPQDTDDISW